MYSVFRVWTCLVVFSFVACSTTHVWAEPEWITSKEGAKLWNPNPQANESCSWTGEKDTRGYATGRGLVVWFVEGRVVEASQGNYSSGRSVGTGIILDASGNATARSDKGKQYDVKLILKAASTDESSQ